MARHLTPIAMALAASLAGCSAASAVAEAPAYDPEGQAKCAVKKSHAEPLIIEWPATQRTKLEALAARRAIAVRYDGCEMEVLAGCKVPREYVYTATSRQKEHLSISNEDELYARLPLGAARLAANLEKAGELNVSMTIVGTYETERSRVHRDELKGDCGRATHVVDALIVGAFVFYAGAGAEVGASAQVGDVGGGAKSTAKSALLRSAGEEKSCEISSDSDSEPPDGCGALLRVEVAMIAPARPRSFVATPDPKPAPSVAVKRPKPLPPVVAPTSSTLPPKPTAVSKRPSVTGRRFTPYTKGQGWNFEVEGSTWYWYVLGIGGGLAVVGTIVGVAVRASESEDETPAGYGTDLGAVPVSVPVIRW